MSDDHPEDPKDPVDLPPVLRVSPEEVARAAPPPPSRVAGAPPPIQAPPPPRWSRLAVTSLVLGLLGIPLTCLPGLFALLAGALALSAIHADSSLRGKKTALGGMALGLISLIGWTAVVWHLLDSERPDRTLPAPPSFPDVAGGLPPEELRDAPPQYRRALLANVAITGSSGVAQWSGSGIVIDRDTTSIRVLTNRHVAEGPAGLDDDGLLRMLLSTGQTVFPRIVWRAPDGVDLCIVEAGVDLKEEIPAVPLERRTATVGQTVFAVGNPLEYRWSLTKGIVSSIRSLTIGKERVKVYQAQVPISRGNSGGGLYTEDGALLGVNTWAADKSISEGLGFSISVGTVLDVLSRSGLEWAARLTSAEGEDR